MSLNLIEIAQAQVVMGGSAISTKQLLTNIVNNIVNPFIYLMITAAVVLFLWGVLDFIRNADSSEERKKGQMRMLYGVVGLFIMMAANGIVNLIIGTIAQ